MYRTHNNGELRIKNIDLIEKVYVQEFNKDFMYLRIKYLGKLEKIIRQLNQENINLNLITKLIMLTFSFIV